jgi:hypothetical protein
MKPRPEQKVALLPPVENPGNLPWMRGLRATGMDLGMTAWPNAVSEPEWLSG